MKRVVLSIVSAPLGLALMLAACPATAQAVHVAANTPEIDAGSAASALTLLLGGAMLLRDRLRSK